MNIRLLAFLFACMAIFSCSKDDTETNPPTEGVTHLFRRMVVGTQAVPDAVYLFSYDSLSRMTNIVDSINQITITAAYGSNGRIGTLTYSSSSGYTRTTHFKYNADNQLIEIDRKQWYRDRYTFEYQNGVLARCNWYTTISTTSDNYSLYRYYTYEMENGNIVKMTAHDANDNIVGSNTYTYTDTPNRFSQLGMFSTAGGPGIYFLSSFENIFNKSLIATIRGSGNHISSCEYLYNTNSQLASFREVWTTTDSDYYYENIAKLFSYN